MAGSPRKRQQREALHAQLMRDNSYGYRDMSEEHKERTLTSLRKEILRRGITESNLAPEEVLQRAIDDAATDYLLLRNTIRAELGDDPDNVEGFFNHPLFDVAERMKAQMAQLSTFAMQYKVQERSMRLSESRTALLAFTLQRTLEQLGVEHETIIRVPGLLLKNLQNSEHAPKIDLAKAEALVEILGNHSEVVIEDVVEAESVVVEPESTPVPKPKPQIRQARKKAA